MVHGAAGQSRFANRPDGHCMKILRWKSFAELTGMAAIVGSLIFVGLQIRQEQVIALGQINLSLLASQIDFNNSINDNADIWVRGNAGDELDQVERIVYEGLLETMAYLHRTERRQYGAFNEERKLQVSVADFALYLHQNPGARQTWVEREEKNDSDRATLIAGFASNFHKAVLADLKKLDEAANRNE